MTINEIISMVDKFRPGNRFDNDMKIRWIYEVDSSIFSDFITPRARKKSHELTPIEAMDPLNLCPQPKGRIFVKELEPYRYEDDPDKTVLAPDRFSDIYVQYIKAKMDAEDGEIDEYNNSVLQYQAAMEEFSSWFIRNYGSIENIGFRF